MGAPTSLIKSVTGMARDYPRDKMPEGYVWDLADYVPVLLDAQLTSRGGWLWVSDAAGSAIEGGIYAPYAAGDKLLVVAGGGLYDVNLTTAALGDPIGSGYAPIRQNPVMLFDKVVIFDGVNLPKVVSYTGGSFTTATPTGSAFPFAYGSVWKSRILGANWPAAPDSIRFSKAGDPLNWDVDAYYQTSLPVTGVGALRAVILVFHAGSVERFRGSAPADSVEQNPGDLNLEPLFDRAGCGDARSIAYWNDNCIFADERGIHLTDGAVVRNMISQGGMLTFWRTLYRNRSTVAACTYLDYYITTVIRTDGVAVTLICDLNRRAFFRFTNVKATSYIQSVGTQERLWAGLEPEHRLASVAECFFPVIAPDTVVQDGNGTPVLPVIETPWYRTGAEGRKRTRFVYASYDSRIPPGATAASWREQFEEIEGPPVEVVATAIEQMLEVGYITNPNEPLIPDPYIAAGRLPSTSKYERYRLPIGKHPYGIAFRIRQIAPSTVTRVYDFAIEQMAEEKSRV